MTSTTHTGPFSGGESLHELNSETKIIQKASLLSGHTGLRCLHSWKKLTMIGMQGVIGPIIAARDNHGTNVQVGEAPSEAHGFP